MRSIVKEETWCSRVGRNKYITEKMVSWELSRKGSDQWLSVPEGFLFELSVSPVFLNRHNPAYLPAACLHDYALHVLKWDRGAATGIFYDVLRAKGVSPFKALIISIPTLVEWREPSHFLLGE